MSPRWVAVCEAPFLPARDGGGREHLGLVRALAARRMLAGLVVCVRPDDPFDAAAYRAALLGPDADAEDLAALERAPVVAVGRSLSPVAHLRPSTPFVWASRRPSRGDRRRLAGVVAAADGVLACSFKSADLALQLARPAGLPVVVRQHNVESAYHRDLGRSRGGPARAYFRWEASRIARAERRMAADPGVVGLAEISSVDAAARTLGSHQRSALVPPLAVDWSAPVPTGPRSGVLFLGALDVATNQHALRWFLDRVWPMVRDALPGAGMTVAGRRPDPAFAAWLEGRGGVRTVYDVDAPRALMGAAVVAVNPTVSGSGINIKLLEYASAGAAVVTTPRATAGLPPVGRSLLVEAESAHAFASAVVDALADPAAAAVRGAALGAELATRLDPAAAVRALAALMDPPPPRAGPARPAVPPGAPVPAPTRPEPEETPACLPSRS